VVQPAAVAASVQQAACVWVLHVGAVLKARDSGTAASVGDVSTAMVRCRIRRQLATVHIAEQRRQMLHYQNCSGT